jgi:hypothetical protein
VAREERRIILDVGISLCAERLDRALFRKFRAVDNLLRESGANVMKSIPLLALVALTENLPAHNLTRGQIGTVVEYLDRNGESALLVEFSDEQGQTYSITPLRPNQLLVLHRNTEAA